MPPCVQFAYMAHDNTSLYRYLCAFINETNKPLEFIWPCDLREMVLLAPERISQYYWLYYTRRKQKMCVWLRQKITYSSFNILYSPRYDTIKLSIAKLFLKNILFSNFVQARTQQLLQQNRELLEHLASLGGYNENERTGLTPATIGLAPQVNENKIKIIHNKIREERT